MKNILKAILAISIVGILICFTFSFMFALLFFIIPIVVIILIIAMFFKGNFSNISIDSHNTNDMNQNGNNICTTTINGKTYTTHGGSQSVVYQNGEIFINGKKQNDKKLNANTIVINGNIDKLETDSSVSVTGNVGSINAKGSVNCDDVKGNIQAGGSVNCDDVGGSIAACGSVNSN